MRTRSARCSKLLWGMASLAALGCGGDQGPHPTLRLSIRGHVLSTDPAPVPVAGATVALRVCRGQLHGGGRQPPHRRGAGEGHGRDHVPGELRALTPA